MVAEIFGDRAFNYAKPLSLIKNLLAQATRPGDIILDFFAGSGTTGQAVLELNAEDNGQRRFILCSSTEATAKEPLKNLCRDVCAERIRRIMQGYGGKPGLGGNFAYLQTELLESADLRFDLGPDSAQQLLALRELRAAAPPGHGPVRLIAGNPQLAVLLCTEVTEESLAILADWPAERLAVYSHRPDTVRHQLEQRSVQVNSYSLLDALQRGQTNVQADKS